MDYVTNSSASLARNVKPVKGTVFCSAEPGFYIITASRKELILRMIDKKGNILHTIRKSK